MTCFMSMLQKHIRDIERSGIVDYRGLEVQPDICVEVQALKILDILEKGTRGKRIKFVKVP